MEPQDFIPVPNPTDPSNPLDYIIITLLDALDNEGIWFLLRLGTMIQSHRQDLKKKTSVSFSSSEKKGLATKINFPSSRK